MKNKKQNQRKELTQECHNSNDNNDNKISISNNQKGSISCNITECSFEKWRTNAGSIHGNGRSLTCPAI